MKNPKTLYFRDWAEVVLARSLARPQTVHGYRSWVAHAEPHIGSVPVGKITSDHIEEVLAAGRAAGLSPKSLSNMLGCLRHILRRAGSTAGAGLRVRVPDPDRRPLGVSEAGQLRLALVPGQPCDDAVLALLGTGLRLAELERLRPRDIVDGGLHVSCTDAGATKSGRARIVDPADYALPAIQRLLASGMPARRTLRRRLDQLCLDACVPRIRVQDLRHTRFTLLLLAGVPALYVCAQAGHHDPSYTMKRYGHVVVASPEERARWSGAA